MKQLWCKNILFNISSLRLLIWLFESRQWKVKATLKYDLNLNKVRKKWTNNLLMPAVFLVPRSQGSRWSTCNKYGCTICPRSSDPFYIVTYYSKWATTSWTDGTYNAMLRIRIVTFSALDPKCVLLAFLFSLCLLSCFGNYCMSKK